MAALNQLAPLLLWACGGIPQQKPKVDTIHSIHGHEEKKETKKRERERRGWSPTATNKDTCPGTKGPPIRSYLLKVPLSF